MQLTIKQLGLITHADLDMRPLTVFVGKNGTGKTWAAHSYFKLLEQLRVEQRPVTPRATDPISTLAETVAAEWQALVEASTSASVSFSVTRDDLIARLPERVSLQVRGSAWPSTLGLRLPVTTRVELRLTRQELGRGEVERIEVTVGKEPLSVQRTLFLASEPEPRTATSYPGPSALRTSLREAVGDLLFGWRKHVRALPAERVNLGYIFPALIQSRDVPMPRALVDFCYMMSLASAATATVSDSALVDEVARVAGGRLAFEERELVFRPTGANGAALPLKAAASLVKSIAGLHVFLSTATRGDVLVIDEPEMNAHPEAQVALTEIFAAMVRRGIHVVVVTHSPYIIDHLSTLLETSRLDVAARERLSDCFSLGSSEVYLLPDELAVYQFEPTGNVREILDRSTGVIDWSTFTKVTEREGRVMAALIEAEESGSGV